MTREIPLTRGLVALVDDEDFDWLNQWKWYAQVGKRTHYAARHVAASEDAGRSVVFMHRVLLGVGPGVVVDHRDRNGLNNRRDNIRLATTTQNNRNASHAVGSSGFRGVHWTPNRGCWRAEIRVDGKKLRCCGFADPAEAARARDEMALRHHGEFAVLNFPHQTGAA